jgi:hypothetical protein
MDAIKVLLKQLVKNVEKSPGWLPLSLLCYSLLWRYGTPDKILAKPLHQRSVSPEVWATVLTLIAYIVGDALDKIIYKRKDEKGGRKDRFNPHWLERARQKARDALGVTDGSYQTSMALIHQAHEALLSVDVLNEFAKFLRSLAIPAFVAAVLLSISARWKLSLIVFAAAIVILVAYVPLKQLHMRNLYEHVARITRSPVYGFHDLGEIRLFFWNGALAGSAPLPKNDAAKVVNSCETEAANEQTPSLSE